MAVRPFPFFSGAQYSRKTCYVYTPPSYEESGERRYPVLYLLHGKNGGETDWLVKGDAESALDGMIRSGDLPECLAVMPNDGGYHHGTFYVDWYDGSGNFEQYIMEDLVTAVDDAFRTVPAREGRAIAGLSMGGYGAVMLALRHPDQFGAAASLSGVTANLESLSREEFARSDFGRMFGPQKGSYGARYDIYRLAAERVSDGPSLYLCCGRDDFLYEMNVRFHRHLTAIGYRHVYEEFAGAHDWSFWKEHLPDALRFVGAHFRNAPGSSD